MDGRGAYLRVGALLVAGIALLVGLTLFLTGSRYEDGKRFESYFKESVQGLEVGAPVKYLGVTLGKVTAIGLVSAEYRDAPAEMQAATYRQVFVRYIIDPKKVGRLPDTEAAVTTGLRAKLASQGLTGLSYIELDFVDPETYPYKEVPWHPREEYIPSMPSTLSQVQDAATEFLAKLNKVDLDQLATDAAGLIGALNASVRDGDVHRALADADALLASLRGAVQGADVPALSAELRRTVASADALLGSRETRAMLDNVSAAAARLPPLLASLEATARRADGGTADLTQSLAPLLRDAQAAVANLRDVTETLRQYPAQALLGGPPPRTEPRR
jgi:ABC-type transporter Mla subunit MlaD